MRTILMRSILFLVIISSLPAQSQQIGQWKSHTNMKNVNCIALEATRIWAGTNGGVFAYDTVSGEYTKFTNTDGLDTNAIQTIAFDQDKSIWIGGAGGWVNVYDLRTHQWQTIDDIATKLVYTKRNIQLFRFLGDTVFIVSEFGVSVFKRSRSEFGDTFLNFGAITSPTVTSMALRQEQMWVGTNKGLAVASLSSLNFWKSYSVSAVPASNSVTSLESYHDTLIIGTTSGMFFIAPNDTVAQNISSFNGRILCDLRVQQGRLYVLSRTGVNFTIDELSSVVTAPNATFTNNTIQGFQLLPAASLWVASGKGLTTQNSGTWNYYFPNGPNANIFNSLIVDGSGVLWCGSGEGPAAGFYKFNPALAEKIRWKNFTSDQYPAMRRNGALFDDYYHVSLGVNGSVWAASWGEGFVEVVADTIRTKLNSYSQPSLPYAVSPDYVVGGSTAVDNEGKTWITSRSTSGTKTLLRYDGDNSGVYFPTSYVNFHDILIDQNGTKWMATSVPWHMEERGLPYFNENMILVGAASNGWGSLSTNQGLLSNVVLSLALDLNGEVWAGLGLGVIIISDPLNPRDYRISYPLYQQVVQAIAVDAVNNKWIGTKEGVFVVNADGTEVLRSYTVQSTNKRLLSNDVRAIAIDQKRGVAYFGTEEGLSSLVIEPIETSKSFTHLDVGPNPFVLPNQYPLEIRNLVVNSTIKIMTVSGSLVQQFDAQGGGRAFWDGRNKNGAFVPSGIYFIVAFSENGSQTATGKVAVIRR